MPIHDWTRVDAGIFHDFHQSWMPEIKRVLNAGRLPEDYYALVGNFKPEGDVYAAKANSVVIRQVSGHRVIAVVEVLSPDNKSSRSALNGFVSTAIEMLKGGVHLLLVDLFAPGSRDPEAIHKAIWKELCGDEFSMPPNKPLTLAAYASSTCISAFVEPAAVGGTLCDMPLFLSPEAYVSVPLEATYQAAWATMPAYWREVLEGGRS